MLRMTHAQWPLSCAGLLCQWLPGSHPESRQLRLDQTSAQGKSRRAFEGNTAVGGESGEHALCTHTGVGGGGGGAREGRGETICGKLWSTVSTSERLIATLLTKCELLLTHVRNMYYVAESINTLHWMFRPREPLLYGLHVKQFSIHRQLTKAQKTKTISTSTSACISSAYCYKCYTV